MKIALTISNCRRIGFYALAALSVCLKTPPATAQSLDGMQSSKTLVEQKQIQTPINLQRSNINYDAYILGPGDGLRIELLDIPELSGSFSIGPDGTIYLPRLRALYVEGLTIEELRDLLTQKFQAYVRKPQIYVRPEVYRPIRIYVGGEVKRPGYYTLTGLQATGISTDLGSKSDGSSSATLFPTVFDAIRSAQGITPYSNLAKVKVIRRRAEGIGGGRIQTNLNFISLITEGNESQNIRLYDGDFLEIGKSTTVIREQLLKAGQSNLSPQFIEVFVTGRVNIPGTIRIPSGGTLNQAISIAGGAKLLKGKIEFIRFKNDGTVERRLFSYNPNAELDTAKNPILAAGDLIRIRDSIASTGVGVLNELTGPFIGIYSIYSIFN